MGELVKLGELSPKLPPRFSGELVPYVRAACAWLMMLPNSISRAGFELIMVKGKTAVKVFGASKFRRQKRVPYATYTPRA